MKTQIKSLLATAILVASPITAVQAQTPTNAEKQALAENFLQADTNNDGALSKSEFQTLMKLNAADNLGRAAMVVRTGAYDKAFERLDTNKNGAISKAEIQQLAEERG